MQVSTLHTTIGWAYDKLQIETRKTYHYDRGNDVTIVERRSITVSLYSDKGQLENFEPKGSNVDEKV